MTRILTGDAIAVLKKLPAKRVQTCVTSPPYWGLRDYGIPPTIWPDGWVGALGLEPTIDLYVAHVVEVFRGVRRVLRDDGTLWANLGDSYAAGGGKQVLQTKNASHGLAGMRHQTPELKPKDLCMIPARVALALQADGWYLRSEIVWQKTNPMPESVRDRPTKSHEMLYLLSKSPRYHCDMSAIREAASPNTHDRTRKLRAIAGQKTLPTAERNGMRPPGVGPKGAKAGSGIRYNESFSAAVTRVLPYRNKRSVWTVPTKPFKGAHFATFPPKLIEPCILAGSRKGDVVLDPFNGAGTTGLVAIEHGRRYLGIELKPEYVRMTRERLGIVIETAKAATA